MLNVTKHLIVVNFFRCLHVDWRIGPIRIYLNPFTTLVSAVIIWAFVIYCVVEKGDANENLKKLRLWITEKWTWLYVGTQDVWAIFIFWLYFSRFGNIKLGNLKLNSFHYLMQFRHLFSKLNVKCWKQGLVIFVPSFFKNNFFRDILTYVVDLSEVKFHLGVNIQNF